ncbi:MAG: CD1375 family protein [Coriobacteriaceae bacterium]|nr:CD1375 family protein [Coriobacteriaceae bacterium]
MGYIYARLIFKGIRTFKSVPAKYKDATKAAYKDIYGIEL